MTTRHVLCSVDDVPEGTAIQVDVDDLSLAVFHVEGGGFHVTDNACTHGPGLLAEGWLEGTVVECDFHLGRFDIVTGAVAGPPCMVPLRTYRTVVDEDKVVIDVAG